MICVQPQLYVVKMSCLQNFQSYGASYLKVYPTLTVTRERWSISCAAITVGLNPIGSVGLLTAYVKRRDRCLIYVVVQINEWMDLYIHKDNILIKVK